MWIRDLDQDLVNLNLFLVLRVIYQESEDSEISYYVCGLPPNCSYWTYLTGPWATREAAELSLERLGIDLRESGF